MARDDHAPAMAGDLRVTPVTSKADLDAFIRLPFALHRDDPQWCPPLLLERRQALDPRHNPFLRRARVRLWLARRGDRPVGRISAQIDPLAPPLRGPGEGHFGMIAGEDDPAVFAALTAAAEGWLREQGIGHAFGPFNLSINEETGLLVDGYDTPPMLLMGHDRPYVAPRLEALGYAKEKDVLAYIVETAAPKPAAAAALLARPLPDGVVLRPLRMKDYDREIQAITDIFNDAWSGNWGFVPLSAEETDAMAKQMRLLIRERLVWFAEVDGAPAAFAVCLPNLNEAIADLYGRLLPFGWAKLLWRLKVSGVRTGRVPLMGVRRRYAETLLGSVLALRVVEAVRQGATAARIDTLEMSWVLEDNVPMRRLAEALGGRAYKTYRIYGKSL